MDQRKRPMPGNGEKILVVDDDPDARDAMQRRLTRRGYSVETADGAQAALEYLERAECELMLLDHNMPGMTGLDLLRLLRATRNQSDLPILMLTAQADSEHLLKAFELGANDYLTKPLDFEVAVVRIGAQLARRQAEMALRQSEERYSLAVRGANDGLWDWDLRAGTIYLSERWKGIVGYEGGEIGAGTSEWFGRIHPDDEKRVRQAIRSHLDGATAEFESEHRLLHRDNTYRWVRARGVAVRPTCGGEATRMAGSLADINSTKVTDPLTGLANRLRFEERLSDVWERYQREPSRLFAVVFVDLDGFKLVNDSLGHQAGDELLREVSRRISRSVRDALVARFGGDEFAVLIEDLDAVEDAGPIGKRMITAIGAPYSIGGRDVFPAGSAGIATVGQTAGGPQELLRCADIALYKAKSNGRNRVEVFNQTMEAELNERMELESELRKAIAFGQLVLHYQPKVRISTGKLQGFEALMRWEHPQRGLMPPVSFIPLAEETGLIVEIGRWVIAEACAQLRRWRDQHPERAGLTMAVNVSTRQMRDAGLVDAVRDALEANGLEPQALSLEITEGALMENTETNVKMLADLKGLGVKVEIDDFGTGYSSLAYLSRFPLDGLKIDRSFVEKMNLSPSDAEIVRSIISLADATGLAVVAEGIESVDQVEALVTAGCSQGQGFYFSRPLSVSLAGELLARPDRLP